MNDLTYCINMEFTTVNRNEKNQSVAYLKGGDVKSPLRFKDWQCEIV